MTPIGRLRHLFPSILIAILSLDLDMALVRQVLILISGPRVLTSLFVKLSQQPAYMRTGASTSPQELIVREICWPSEKPTKSVSVLI